LGFTTTFNNISVISLLFFLIDEQLGTGEGSQSYWIGFNTEKLTVDHSGYRV